MTSHGLWALLDPGLSLRARFAWIVGSSGLVFAMLLVTLIWTLERRELEASAGRTATQVAHQIRQTLTLALNERRRQIIQIAGDPRLASGLVEPAMLREMLEQIRSHQPELVWIGITGANGQVTAATGGLLEGRDLQQQPWFKTGMQQPWISDAHPAHLLAPHLPPEPDGSPARLLDIAAPIHDTYGQITGVVAAHLRWNWIEQIGQSLLSTAAHQAGMEAVLLDSRGEVLLGLDGQFDGTHDLTRLTQALHGGPAVLVWPDGQSYLTAEAGSPEPAEQQIVPGWRLLVRQNAAQAFAAAERLALGLLAAGTLASLLFAALSWHLATRMARPIGALARTAEQLRSGEQAVFDIGSSRRSDEVTRLAASLRAMHQAIRDEMAQRERIAQRYRNLFETSPDAIVVIGDDAHIELVNPAAMRLFGAESAGLLLNRPMLDFFAAHEHEHMCLRALDIIKTGQPGSALIERQALRLDGTPIEVEVAAAPFDDDGRPALHVVMRDISGRKQAERALLQAQEQIRSMNARLEQRVAERTAELQRTNAELDSFTYAVSHDLRAPLRAMSGFSQALQEDHAAQLDPEARMFLDQISHASHRMGELIDGLLVLSRSSRSEIHHDRIDLSARSLSLLQELARTEPQRRVRWEIEPGLAADGDRRMIEAVLRNLLGNAWKYTARRDDALIRVHATRHDDGRSGICISDNGAGFDMAHATRLFKPFQRLHRQDEFPGLGIGLATVQRIIERHGGWLQARASPGAGASFCFGLPDTPPSAGQPHDTAATQHTHDHEDHPAG